MQEFPENRWTTVQEHPLKQVNNMLNTLSIVLSSSPTTITITTKIGKANLV